MAIDMIIQKLNMLITKVEIICEKHGVFQQLPTTHINGGGGCPICSNELRNLGYNEKYFFTPFVEQINVNFEKQYYIMCENGNYFLDFYFPEINIAIEYDEKQHFLPKNIINDKKREDDIIQEMGCEIIRVNDEKFMNDIEYKERVRSVLDDKLNQLYY
jgi:very-short-patch-repair endonuclease